MRPESSACRIAVDIGGTFTDIVLTLPDGGMATRKVSSTPSDYSRGIVTGVSALLRDLGVAPGDISAFLHATTVGSNTILERKGAKVGLITTRGFRDILELRRLRMPRLYDLGWEKPAPMVPRYLRREVSERLDAGGRIQIPLDEAEVASAVDFLALSGVDAIAICFLHAYANSDHERRAAEIALARAPHLSVCLSSDVLPEIREYERMSTTVTNAYLLPVIGSYLGNLRRELNGIGIHAPILVMQSSGGLIPDSVARKYPVHIIESGPAAGVIGTRAVAESINTRDVISFDMGGTTAKASIIENGELTVAAEYQVGAGLIHGSRLLTGAGYLVRVPSVDLAEIGAGGGSHIAIDAGGLICVGPTSAGSDPGPICYGAGGDIPTITDANLLLGYLSPSGLAGGAVALNVDKARQIFEDRIARPLAARVEEAAYAAHMIAASNMIRAIKAVSSERGRDPRGFSLFAFGGNGPLFAVSVAKALHMRDILIPPFAGVFSSAGLLYSGIERHFIRTLLVRLHAADPAELNASMRSLEDSARSEMAAMGLAENDYRIERRGSLRYRGQSFELPILLRPGVIDSAWIQELVRMFGEEHERTYGHKAEQDEPVEMVTMSVVGRQTSKPPRLLNRGTEVAAELGRRMAYFGPEAGWSEVPILNRAALSGGRPGPLIIEDYDATCVVPQGAFADLTDEGCIAIRLSDSDV